MQFQFHLNARALSSFPAHARTFQIYKTMSKGKAQFDCRKTGCLKPMLFEKNGTIQFDIRESLRRPVGS